MDVCGFFYEETFFGEFLSGSTDKGSKAPDVGGVLDSRGKKGPLISVYEAMINLDSCIWDSIFFFFFLKEIHADGSFTAPLTREKNPFRTSLIQMSPALIKTK